VRWCYSAAGVSLRAEAGDLVGLLPHLHAKLNQLGERGGVQAGVDLTCLSEQVVDGHTEGCGHWGYSWEREGGRLGGGQRQLELLRPPHVARQALSVGSGAKESFGGVAAVAQEAADTVPARRRARAA
jgi:hypothetical protein